MLFLYAYKCVGKEVEKDVVRIYIYYRYCLRDFHQSLIVKKKHSIGTLRIDNSDSDGPYLFLELSTNISSFNKKKQVTLNVLDESYLPQK